jgi:LysM repeat protein
MTERPSLTRRCILSIGLALLTASVAAAADPLVHVVAKGETLYAIARKYDITVDSLAKANTISDPSKLFVGMKLTIPDKSGAHSAANPAAAPTAVAPTAVAPTAVAPTAAPVPVPPPQTTIEYVVRKGDTLYAIAKAHGVSVDAILKASGMSTMTIKQGQKLRIPGNTEPRYVTAVPAAGASAAGASAAGASAAALPSSTGTLWPVRGPVAYLKGKLKGVSIATGGAAGIQAIRAGTVISAGPFRGFGQVAFVQASDGLVYVYGGAAELSVRLGDAVRKGSIIGRTAAQKDAAAYFFVFKGADTIDPDSVPRD